VVSRKSVILINEKQKVRFQARQLSCSTLWVSSALKCLAVTNTLTYYRLALMNTVKSFIVQAFVFIGHRLYIVKNYAVCTLLFIDAGDLFCWPSVS